MSHVPTVSIGMPVYNAERTLRESVDSILSQTFSDFELIISDNASADGTEAICRTYVERDSRVAYHRQPQNLGITENYNTVFRLSNAPYFKWASSSDICMPEFLSKCVAVQQNHSDVVLCYPRTRLFNSRTSDVEDYNDDLNLVDEDPLIRFYQCIGRLRLNNALNGVIRADVLARTGLIKAFFMSDVCLMAELSLHGKFVEVPEFLFYRRMDPDTATKLMEYEKEVKYFDPTKTTLLFQEWKKAGHPYGAVWRSPLPLRHKLRVYRRLLRRTAWARWALLGDVKDAMAVIWRTWMWT